MHLSYLVCYSKLVFLFVAFYVLAPWINRIIRATDVQIVGDVQIGKCCVLNPQCRIIAEKGAKIVIGSHNLVEDQVTIHCSAGNTLQIGSHNHISVGTLVQDAQVSFGSMARSLIALHLIWTIPLTL